MKPVIDAPRTSKAALTAPVNAIHQEALRAARVMTIYEEKYEHLCLLAIKYLNKSEVFAEDIVADVFIDALKVWPTATYEKIKDLEAFICRCIINRSKNFRLRNKRLINIHDLPLDSLSTINPMLKLELDMDGLTNMLPKKQREAFSLYCKGYTHEEIMHMLRLSSEGASKNLIYYAKKKLQKIWSDLPDDDPDNPETPGARSKRNKQVSRPLKNPMSIQSGKSPRVKDLLAFLNGDKQNNKIKNAIALWIIEDKYANEIISGLRYALNSNIGTNIEARLKKGKASLRERLIGTVHARTEPCNPFMLNSAQQFLYKNTIEHNNQNCLPILDNSYSIMETWAKTPKKASLPSYLFNPNQLCAVLKSRPSNNLISNYLEDKIRGDVKRLNTEDKLLNTLKNIEGKIVPILVGNQHCFIVQVFIPIDEQGNNPKSYDTNRLSNCYLLSIDIDLDKH